MTSLTLTVQVSLVNGKPIVSSRDIALRFQRKHKTVLQDIARIISMCPKYFTGQNFLPSEYIDPTGRSLPCYNLTRDAFSLLAMGFTGKAAILWKLQYIEAFNALEAAALDAIQGQLAQARSEGVNIALALQPAERARIMKVVAYRKRGFSYREIAAVMGISRQSIWHSFKTARLLGLEVENATA